MVDQQHETDVTFLEIVGLISLVCCALAALIFCLAHVAGGSHDTTEVYPICSRGRIAIRAVNSEHFGSDRTIEIFLDKRRIGYTRIADPDTWERFASAMREPYAGCK